MRVIEQRARQPGANLYLIADADGRILTGNVESLEPGVLAREGWTERPFIYRRFGESRGRTPVSACRSRPVSGEPACGDRRWCSACPTR